MPRVELAAGHAALRDEGEGPVVVLVHGLLVTARCGPGSSRLLAGVGC